MPSVMYIACSMKLHASAGNWNLSHFYSGIEPLYFWIPDPVYDLTTKSKRGDRLRACLRCMACIVKLDFIDFPNKPITIVMKPTLKKSL